MFAKAHGIELCKINMAICYYNSLKNKGSDTMSTFREFKKKCTICGTESKFNIITSTNSFGSPDLDLRPPEMRRSTMWLWIQRCPCCNYVNYDVESISSVKE